MMMRFQGKRREGSINALGHKELQLRSNSDRSFPLFATYRGTGKECTVWEEGGGLLLYTAFER